MLKSLERASRKSCIILRRAISENLEAAFAASAIYWRAPNDAGAYSNWAESSLAAARISCWKLK